MWWKHKHKRQGSVLKRNKEEEYMSFSRLKCICIENCHLIWCILSLSLRDKIQGSQCAAFTPDLHNLSIRAKPRSALSLSPKHKSNITEKKPLNYIQNTYTQCCQFGGWVANACLGGQQTQCGRLGRFAQAINQGHRYKRKVELKSQKVPRVKLIS